MAAVFEWDDRYSLNIPEIDAENRQLVDLVNQAFETLGQDSTGIPNILTRLREFADAHFSREVRYMEQTQYPRIAEHNEDHEEFLRNLREFEARKTLDSPLDLAIRVSLFLREWLQEHLLGEDRKLFVHVGSIPPPKP